MNNWVALLTPPLPGAVAVWAVRGPDSWNIIAPSLKALRGSELNMGFIPTHARLARWNIVTGSSGDEVLVVPRANQPVPWFEIHGHSGPELLRWQSHWFRTHGFRIATPESFCFWVEKDRLEGETVNCLSKALTRRGVNGIQSQSILCRSTLAQCSDWLEKGMWQQAMKSMNEMANGYRQTKAWTSGWKVVLCGPPNVGKSTLLNALLGTARSLVSSVPGTTRDAVHALTILDGWVVELIDMAGWRQSEDPLESAGIKLGKELTKSADLVLLLSDSAGKHLFIQETRDWANTLQIYTKCDLLKSHVSNTGTILHVSAHKEIGIEELGKRIVDNLTDNGNLPSGPAAFSFSLKESLLRAVQAAGSGKIDDASECVRQWLEPVPQPTEVEG